eukprot:gene26810-32392_t
MLDIKADVAIVGGGPAGTALAYLMQAQQNLSVVLIDPAGDSKRTWYPNYGEWLEEWEHLSDALKLPELRDCTTTEWSVTDCFFGGSHGLPPLEKTRLDRGYVRVDRVKMQALLRDKYEESGGRILSAALQAQLVGTNIFNQNIVHDAQGSVLSLSTGDQVRCAVVVDASGAETKITCKENARYVQGRKALPTSYQVAYGFIAHVDSLGPYDPDAMTLFDYRTDFLDEVPEWKKAAEEKPTFMYVMPLGRTASGQYRVFFEETSLVARGA